MTEEYRLHHGEIQLRIRGDRWVRSAHDSAALRELPHYEWLQHPVAPLIRQKYGVRDA